MADKFLTIRTISRGLDVSPQNIQQLIRKGRFPAIKEKGASCTSPYKVDRQAFLGYLNNQVSEQRKKLTELERFLKDLNNEKV